MNPRTALHGKTPSVLSDDGTSMANYVYPMTVGRSHHFRCMSYAVYAVYAAYA